MKILWQRLFHGTAHCHKRKALPKHVDRFGTQQVQNYVFPKKATTTSKVTPKAYPIEELMLDKVKRPNIKFPLTLHHIMYESHKNYNERAPPVIFLHGFLNNATIFSGVARAINGNIGRPCLGMDLRNHGCTAKKFPHDYITMAEDVIHTIDEYKFGRITLVGHSMGAKVAMLVALKRPDVVHNLVIIDNAPTENDVVKLDKSIPRILKALCFVERRTHEKYGKKQKLYPPFYDDIVKIMRDFQLNDMTIEAMLSNVVLRKKTKVQTPVLEFFKYNITDEMNQWPEFYFTDDNGGFKKFDKPVLVIKSKYSRFINQQNIEQDFPKYFTNVTVTEMETGHFSFIEKPHEFTTVVSDFINKVQSPRQLLPRMVPSYDDVVKAIQEERRLSQQSSIMANDQPETDEDHSGAIPAANQLEEEEDFEYEVPRRLLAARNAKPFFYSKAELQQLMASKHLARTKLNNTRQTSIISGKRQGRGKPLQSSQSSANHRISKTQHRGSKTQQSDVDIDQLQDWRKQRRQQLMSKH